MRKLIEMDSQNLIECDNLNCDYTVPTAPGDENIDSANHSRVVSFINKPCPECGENLLTIDDYKNYDVLLKTVAWINKWFSWLTIFEGNKKRVSTGVKVHKGIKFEK